jgi:AraC family transcriptional regulator
MIRPMPERQPEAVRKNEHEAAVARAISFVLQDLDRPTRLAEIAAVAGFSPHHFNRLFSGCVGESVMEFARRVRLERAAYRLRETKQSVSEIGFEAGYDAYEAFSRSFRSAFGVSPSTFRKTVGLPPFVDSRSRVHWTPRGGVSELEFYRPVSTAMNYRITTFPAIRVAAWRHIGPHYSIHETWERLQALLEEKGWTDARCFSVFLNSPADNPPDALETDVCFSVPDDFERQEGLHLFELPAGDYASFRHEGIDMDLGNAWNRLFTDFLPLSARTCIGPCFEEYVGGWSPQLGSVTTEVFVGVR